MLAEILYERRQHYRLPKSAAGRTDSSLCDVLSVHRAGSLEWPLLNGFIGRVPWVLSGAFRDRAVDAFSGHGRALGALAICSGGLKRVVVRQSPHHVIVSCYPI